jgi:acyl-CoA synthetase (AMP-forming)/AMP-acid ligase II
VLGTSHPETLTWAQVYRRALVIAEELRRRGSAGDCAAILAHHGLDYIVAFSGALQAGFVARAKELAAKYGDRFNPPASLQA